jgi:hypothetical protein
LSKTLQLIQVDRAVDERATSQEEKGRFPVLAKIQNILRDDILAELCVKNNSANVPGK